MKIGIGGTLARGLAAAGRRVTITNSKGAENVRSYAQASTLSMQARWRGRGDSSCQRLPIAAIYDADTMHKGLALAARGEAPKKRDHLVKYMDASDSAPLMPPN